MHYHSNITGRRRKDNNRSYDEWQNRNKNGKTVKRMAKIVKRCLNRKKNGKTVKRWQNHKKNGKTEQRAKTVRSIQYDYKNFGTRAQFQYCPCCICAKELHEIKKTKRQRKAEKSEYGK